MYTMMPVSDILDFIVEEAPDCNADDDGDEHQNDPPQILPHMRI